MQVILLYRSQYIRKGSFIIRSISALIVIFGNIYKQYLFKYIKFIGLFLLPQKLVKTFKKNALHIRP